MLRPSSNLSWVLTGKGNQTQRRRDAETQRGNRLFSAPLRLCASALKSKASSYVCFGDLESLDAPGAAASLVDVDDHAAHPRVSLRRLELRGHRGQEAGQGSRGLDSDDGVVRAAHT